MIIQRFGEPKFEKPIKKIKSAKEKIWIEASGLRRKEIEQEYNQIDNYLKSHEKRKIPSKKLADNLGTKVLGFNGEHPSVQIYAFDSLIKSISGAKNETDIDTIVEEILFDTALEKHPLKKEYLLGILAYYSNRERLAELEEKIGQKPTDAQSREINIIAKINNSVARLSKRICYSERMHQIIDYILGGFPRDIKECERARLVATYYGYEVQPTRMPEPGRAPIIDIDNIGRRLKGSGIPRYIYPLPPTFHPSKKKLEEADDWGIDLVPQPAVFEGEDKIFIDYDINPKLARFFNQKMRDYKDKARDCEKRAEKAEKKAHKCISKRNIAQAGIYRRTAERYRAEAAQHYQRLEALEERLKEKIWQELDSGAKKAFKSKDNLVVLKRTIRDYPQEAIPGLLQNILESKPEKAEKT